MTNPPGGVPDMQALMQQAQSLIAAQQELAEATVDGTAGGGLVRATVTGGGELVALTIDKQVIDPSDPETLADLVIAAVRDANGKAQSLAADRMGSLTGGLGGLGGGLGLPGLG